jgi:serine protease Do
MGSGFIIDKKGLIVTNNHVIANASSITVILHDGTSLQAKLLGSDAKTDLALLKVETKIKLKTVKWGDSDEIKVGNWAMAIGNPFGLVNTVTVGIVSARARDINAGPFDDFIQTDASINRGNSGGPLFNLNGDVIGVNTAIYSPSGGSVGIGFAIPSALAQNIVQQLEDHGRTIRGWLGVRIQTVTDDLASSLGLEKAYGALVASSIPNSPAEKAGIKAGDIILNFNGKDVTEMRKLPRFVAETEVNKEVNIVVWRNEKKKTLKVSIAEMKEDKKIMAKKEADKKTTLKEDDISDLKIRVSQITNNIRLRQNIPEDITGLLITRVEQNSDAERKGIRPGDIIQEVNQTSVNSIEEFKGRHEFLADLREKYKSKGQDFKLHNYEDFIQKNELGRYLPIVERLIYAGRYNDLFKFDPRIYYAFRNANVKSLEYLRVDYYNIRRRWRNWGFMAIPPIGLLFLIQFTPAFSPYLSLSNYYQIRFEDGEWLGGVNSELKYMPMSRRRALKIMYKTHKKFRRIN